MIRLDFFRQLNIFYLWCIQFFFFDCNFVSKSNIYYEKGHFVISFLIFMKLL